MPMTVKMAHLRERIESLWTRYREFVVYCLIGGSGVTLDCQGGAWLRGMVWCCLLPLVSGGIAVSGLPFKLSLFSVALPIGLFVVLAVALWRTGWRGALGAVLFLIVSFFLADAFALGGIGDDWLYRFPQVFLLEDGWNPVLYRMTESAEAVGLDLGDVRLYHVFFLPVFNAAWAASVDSVLGSLGGFVWEAFLFLPLVALLAVRVGRLIAPSWRWMGLLLFLTSFAACYRGNFIWSPTDALGAFVYVALVFALVLSLRGQSQYFWMSVCTVFLLCTKPNHASYCVLIWGALAIGLFVFRRWEEMRRVFLVLFPWLAIVVLWLNFHPYLTGWVCQGSPLYPFHSFTLDVSQTNILSDLGTAPEGAVPSLRALVKSPILVFAAFPFVMTGLLWKIRHPVWPLVGWLLFICAVLTPSRCYNYSRYYLWLPLLPVLLGCMLLEGRLRLTRWLGVAVLLCVTVALGGIVALRTITFGTFSFDLYKVTQAQVTVKTWPTSPDWFPAVYPPNGTAYTVDCLLRQRAGNPIEHVKKKGPSDIAFPDRPIAVTREDAERLGLDGPSCGTNTPSLRATLRFPIMLVQTIFRNRQKENRK